MKTPLTPSTEATYKVGMSINTESVKNSYEAVSRSVRKSHGAGDTSIMKMKIPLTLDDENQFEARDIIESGVSRLHVKNEFEAGENIESIVSKSGAVSVKKSHGAENTSVMKLPLTLDTG